MNLQNWPHDLLSYLLADEGYIYYAFDLSQIENRIVAYVGNVIQQIEVFESGMSPHRTTAALIFGIPYDEVSDEDGSATIGGGKYSQRFWGKKGNHSFNYDFGYKGFSLEYEITETDGKWIYDRYHTAYPGVQESYHAGVQMLLRKNRTLTNLFGRKRTFLGRLDNKTFKEAYAQIPQSTAADKTNRQGINYIYYNQQDFSPIELLIQVHDSIGFQIPLSLPWKDHAMMLWKIRESLETPLVTTSEWGQREFKVPVDLTMGLTLNKNDGHEFKHSSFPATKDELTKELKRVYDENFRGNPGSGES